ncbi:VOC family protein [Pseudonocardia hierapolitana]|uniref:VOC family protein n=1 Tax=Pseudonocardia hierapolitana TaxID=1128676 RepID=UPI001FEC079A|nr:VOC family protein [Pseudonocardia hierapolitana]
MTTTENAHGGGIARFGVVALDCPDPVALARFYSAITGWPFDPHAGSDGWVQLDPPDGRGAGLGFQKVSSEYRPPQWPGQEVPQQLHIDFDVPDLDEGERRVLAIGARKHEVQPAPDRFRVYLDPAGHPFCLVRA